MSGRVLATPEAEQAITRIQTILTGEFTNQIKALDKEGTTLSQPDVWDGPLAQKFRGDWQQTNAALDKVTQQLLELQTQLDKIRQNIMTAGGGA